MAIAPPTRPSAGPSKAWLLGPLALGALAMGFAAAPLASPWPLALNLGGLALWAWALQEAPWAWPRLALAVWAAGYVKLNVGQHWHVLTYAHTVQVSWPEQVVGYLGVTFLWAALSKGPLVGAVLLGRRWPWLWPLAFGLAWAGGEALVSWIFVLSQDDWWSPLWQEAWALRVVAWWGWTPSLIAVLVCVALATQGLPEGRVWPRLVAALGLVGLSLAPRLPEPDLSPLAGVGAVAMPDYAPHPWPTQGLKLLLWPELTSSEAPYLSEGQATALRRVRTPLHAPALHQILGLRVRQAAGLDLNALVLTGPGGQVLGVRGKRLLFPFIETPVGGILLWNQAFRRGEAPAILHPPGLPSCAALLCLEAMDHGQARQAKALGARWIAVGAQDGMLVGHPWALHQVMGMTVWLSVCTGLPVVRASMKGQAAIVAPNGRVLLASAMGQRTVLRWPPLQP